jgi:CheY-like chemotaxis protein
VSRYAVVVVPDLFFRTRIEDVARQIGVELVAVAADEILDTCRGRRPDVVVMDLTDPADTVRVATVLRADPATRDLPIVGFYPHVDVGLRERALAAGVTHVLPRSAFTRRIAELLLSP